MLPRFVVRMVSVGMAVLGAGVVSGQDYPNKPVRIITGSAGSSPDWVSRLIAQGITGGLGQQVIVDNRAGIIAIETVAKAPPDGYTVLLHASNIWLLPFMRDNVPWNPVRDFLPITMAVSQPNLIVVHPSVPVKSIKELIALAKARPGEFNHGSIVGGSTHLAAELFKAMAGVDIVHIPYKGAGPAINDLIGGQLQLMFATAGTAAPHVRSGRLRALAVTSAEPSALAPGLPTVAASGLPGYVSTSISGMFAPARTAETIIRKLNQESVRFLRSAETKERFFNAGVEAVGSSPDEFSATMKSEMARLGKVIKDAGIRAE